MKIRRPYKNLWQKIEKQSTSGDAPSQESLNQSPEKKKNSKPKKIKKPKKSNTKLPLEKGKGKKLSILV